MMQYCRGSVVGLKDLTKKQILLSDFSKRWPGDLICRRHLLCFVECVQTIEYRQKPLITRKIMLQNAGTFEVPRVILKKKNVLAVLFLQAAGSSKLRATFKGPTHKAATKHFKSSNTKPFRLSSFQSQPWPAVFSTRSSASSIMSPHPLPSNPWELHQSKELLPKKMGDLPLGFSQMRLWHPQISPVASLTTLIVCSRLPRWRTWSLLRSDQAEDEQRPAERPLARHHIRWRPLEKLKPNQLGSKSGRNQTLKWLWVKKKSPTKTTGSRVYFSFYQ